MKALIDGDILRFEIGYAAETGWKATTDNRESIPPFDYVKDMLHQRIEYILNQTGSEDYDLYLTEGRTFRYDISDTYKATRKDTKPWHFKNLTAYLSGPLGAKIITGIEADDAMAIDKKEDCIICSRDKDLRQIPGWFYSWELWKQPSFGPVQISKEGTLSLESNNKKLSGTGLAFFYAQVLTGDKVDNIPGLPGCGPVAAYNLLTHRGELLSTEEMFTAVRDAFDDDDEFLKQGRLCWIVRRLDASSKPVMYELGMEE